MLKLAWMFLLISSSLAFGYYAIHVSASPEAKTVEGWNRRLHVGMDQEAIRKFLSDACKEKANFHPLWCPEKRLYECHLRDIEPTSRTRKDIVLIIHVDEDKRLVSTDVHTVTR